MLSPKRVKYRKVARGVMKGYAYRGNRVSFGEYGIMAMEQAWISAQQIESSRLALVRSIRKGGKIWIRIFPDKPFTKKPAETRMGKGKGMPEKWVAVVKPGRVMFEIAGLALEDAKRAYRMVSHKLPIKTKLLIREQENY